MIDEQIQLQNST